MVALSVQLNAGKVGLCDLTPRRSFSTTVALLQIGFSLVLLKKTDDGYGGRVCRSTTACGATS